LAQALVAEFVVELDTHALDRDMESRQRRTY